jgi:natural product biosynthesis luciferase-like monooxygenase protein
MSSTRAVFIGNGSLLIQCAQAWMDAGHAIVCIATRSADVVAWAEAQGVVLVHLDRAADLQLPDVPFDYLFSVANLQVLPARIVSSARTLALNFHDGPLPRYAGLNATAWALIDRQPEHGVTWHEMTDKVDAGRIARQARFAIGPADTALSLNARCYEEGLACFRDIILDITRDALTLTPQAGPRSYFGRHQRPDALATLDFTRPAADLAALVRALDFGGYANPLVRPKVYCGDDILLVRSAEAAPSVSAAQPGTVLSVDGDRLRVATSDGDLLLSGCTRAEGDGPGAMPAAGAVLPPIPDALRERLAAAVPRLAAGEPHWTRLLEQAVPVELPYPRRGTNSADSCRIRVPLQVQSAGARTAAAFCAWLSALTGQESVSIAYSDEALDAQSRGLRPWLSPWVPLHLVTQPDSTVSTLIPHAEQAITAAHEAGPLPRDLATRLGDRHAAPDRLRAIRLSLGGEAPVDGAALVLARDVDGGLVLLADEAVYARSTALTMASHLAHWLRVFDQADGRVRHLLLAPDDALRAPDTGARPMAPTKGPRTIHEAIEAQAARTPSLVALRWHDETVAYAELSARADAMATALRNQGVRHGDVIGLCLERTPQLVVALLAILKTGAAYVPLDPAYPTERIAHMIDDSRTRLIVTTGELASRLAMPLGRVFDVDAPSGASNMTPAEIGSVGADNPAYVIYTSGSTGKPKGVVVTHANVMNFFAGMDERVPHERPGRWLAVTSLSFDISVLELCWTLARGFTVVLHSNVPPARPKAGPEFSLFYFASDNAATAQDRYRLLMEGAKFADRNGFSAVWTPERHFHAFGGLYPNPAVTSAAIAAATTRLQIRAGSCVLPLHHPIRVAEEWAFVDNISQGRVGISFASGWQPNDFVIAPQAFANRKTEMLENIDVVRRLWRGEAISFPGPLGKPVEVRTLPRPVQKELPVWVTAAGNPETFEQAGRMGCRLLTHLLGQNIPDVAEKLRLYRMAWRAAGHAGNGHVTLMLHAFVGADEDEVRETVRGPMKEYLRSSIDLIKQAAWSFPTFVQRGAANGKTPVEIMDSAPLSEAEMDALLDHAFNRYYGTSALFGTPERCLALVAQLQTAGVDEIACLIDFGIATDTVLAHLHDLKRVMDAAQDLRPSAPPISVAEQIVAHEITHLQCTPSMASMLVADAPGRAALGRLSVLMVGGEALPLALAKDLRGLVPGKLLNMYGPTETTIWSTTCELHEVGDFVPLGEPIVDTILSVRTPWGAECPAGVPGELLIGGAGVAHGYLGRPELTAERFVHDTQRRRFYRTGDLVRRHAAGALEFLGRLDHQVKIRGHRIELGEIETLLARQPGVKDAVVIARGDTHGDQRLVGYVTARAGMRPDTRELLAALARELPEVMVPHALALLPALPLTPNGKVDRKALPEPQSTRVMLPGTEPQSDLEGTIASIWREVLGLAQVGATDNFFDLGGHSLLVVQVQRRLREACGREVSITDMFRLPTIRALAAHLGAGAPEASAVGDGLNRARARKLMRDRSAARANAAPVA